MAINASRVVVGGLAAGVVANIVGFVAFGILLGQRLDAEAAAVAPALRGRGMSSDAIAANVVTSFALGFLLVWLYAAMRPRFGTGAKTAVYAALAVGVCEIASHLEWLIAGMMTPLSYVLASLAGLVQLLAAALVGAMLYKEGAAT
jgi:hypothetical protein